MAAARRAGERLSVEGGGAVGPGAESRALRGLGVQIEDIVMERILSKGIRPELDRG